MSSLLHLVPNRTALIAVDMQNGFCSAGGSVARLGLDVERMNRTILAMRRLIDAFHGAGAPVVYTKYVLRPDHADAGLLRARFPALHSLGHLIEGSWDAAIADDVRPAEIDFVVRKRRFDAFYDSELELVLRCQGIDTLVVGGVPTNTSVESTVRGAFARDYDVLVPREATASFTAEMESASLLTLEFIFARVVPVGRVIAALGESVAEGEPAAGEPATQRQGEPTVRSST